MFKALTSLQTLRGTYYAIYLIYCTLRKPTGKISDQSMMIVYRPIEVTDHS